MHRSIRHYVTRAGSSKIQLKTLTLGRRNCLSPTNTSTQTILFCNMAQSQNSSGNETYRNAISDFLTEGSVPTAVKSFTKPLSDASSKDEVESQLWSAWAAITKEAAHVDAADSKQDKLVALLGAIKVHGDLQGDQYSTWGGKVWSDLPVLGAQMREEWNDTPPKRSVQEWTNLNAFAARLEAAGVADFGLYAIWAFRDALEESHSSAKADDLNWKLSATLVWLEYAGSKLLQSTKDNKSYKPEGQANAPDPSKLGSLAKEANVSNSGYSNERWQFWGQRLHDISEQKDDAGGKDKVAKLAYSALEKLQRSE